MAIEEHVGHRITLMRWDDRAVMRCEDCEADISTGTCVSVTTDGLDPGPQIVTGLLRPDMTMR